jgi:hypothetical protein
MSDSKVTTLDDAAALADEAVTTKAAPRAAKTLKGANHDAALSGNKRILTIHQTNDDGGSEDVFVGVNGYGYQIKRGEPVEVPEEVVKVIENAKQELMVFGKDGQVITRTTPRYPFSVQ